MLHLEHQTEFLRINLQNPLDFNVMTPCKSDFFLILFILVKFPQKKWKVPQIFWYLSVNQKKRPKKKIVVKFPQIAFPTWKTPCRDTRPSSPLRFQGLARVQSRPEDMQRVCYIITV